GAHFAPHQAVVAHRVDGVRAATADTDDLDQCQVVPALIPHTQPVSTSSFSGQYVFSARQGTPPGTPCQRQVARLSLRLWLRVEGCTRYCPRWNAHVEVAIATLPEQSRDDLFRDRELERDCAERPKPQLQPGGEQEGQVALPHAHHPHPPRDACRPREGERAHGAEPEAVAQGRSDLGVTGVGEPDARKGATRP